VLNYDENNKVSSFQLDYINRAGSSNAILREVLGIDSSMPIWAEKTLDEIIRKYSQVELTSESLTNLKQELAEIGLDNYIPDTIARVVEEGSTDD